MFLSSEHLRPAAICNMIFVMYLLLILWVLEVTALPGKPRYLTVCIVFYSYFDWCNSSYFPREYQKWFAVFVLFCSCCFCFLIIILWWNSFIYNFFLLAPRMYSWIICTAQIDWQTLFFLSLLENIVSGVKLSIRITTYTLQLHVRRKRTLHKYEWEICKYGCCVLC